MHVCFKTLTCAVIRTIPDVQSTDSTFVHDKRQSSANKTSVPCAWTQRCIIQNCKLRNDHHAASHRTYLIICIHSGWFNVQDHPLRCTARRCRVPFYFLDQLLCRGLQLGLVGVHVHCAHLQIPICTTNRPITRLIATPGWHRPYPQHKPARSGAETHSNVWKSGESFAQRGSRKAFGTSTRSSLQARASHMMGQQVFYALVLAILMNERSRTECITYQDDVCVWVHPPYSSAVAISLQILQPPVCGHHVTAGQT